jgi:NACHT domain
MDNFSLWAIITAIGTSILVALKPILEFINARPKILNKPKGLLKLLGSSQNLLAYRQHIEKLYSSTNLIGINTPIHIKNIFTELYILDEPTANKRHTYGSLKALEEEDLDQLIHSMKKTNGIEVIKNRANKRLLVLGSPGSGKTTFLKYITYLGAQGIFGDKLVSFISLKQWSDADKEKLSNLLDYLVKQFEMCSFDDAKSTIERYLNGNFIVLLDGLDEVFGDIERFKEIHQKIDEFCSTYLYTQVIISCRTNELPIGFTKFTKVEIAEFDKSQIENFVRNWVNCQQVQDENYYKNFFTEFNKQENKKVGEMASIPILLSLLCIVFKDNGTFPKNKMQVYRQALDILLDETEMNMMRDYIPSRSIIYKDLDLGKRKELFNNLAYLYSLRNELLFEKNEIKEIVEYILRNILQTSSYIDALKILREIETQHGIIIERFKDIFSFAHRSFQEFFTATFFIDNNKFDELLTEKNILGGLRETILNTASILKNDKSILFFNTFLTSINENSKKSVHLKDWIKLANEKSLKVVSDKAINKIRVFYLYLIMIEASDFIHSRFHAYDLDYYKQLEQWHAQDIIRELDINCFNAFNLIYKKVEYFDETLALTINIGVDADLAFDYGIVILKIATNAYYFNYNLLKKNKRISRNIHQLLINTMDNCEKLNETNLNKTNLVSNLKKLAVIIEDISKLDLDETMQIINQMLQIRKIKTNFKIQPSEIGEFLSYFQTNHLLLECLKLAVISNRQAIKDKMFLPIESD